MSHGAGKPKQENGYWQSLHGFTHGGAVAPFSMSFGSCAYDWKQLVGLVVPLVTIDPSITLKTVKQELDPYLKRAVHSSLISRLKKKAMIIVYGDADNEVKKLPGILEALKIQGWHVGNLGARQTC